MSSNERSYLQTMRLEVWSEMWNNFIKDIVRTYVVHPWYSWCLIFDFGQKYLAANNVRRGRKEILSFLAFACFINLKQDEHRADLNLACHCCVVPRCLTLISVICKPFQGSLFKVKVSGSRCTALSNGITQIKSDIAIRRLHRCLIGPYKFFQLLFINEFFILLGVVSICQFEENS